MPPSKHPKGTRMESVLFPNFVRSTFNGRDFFSELEQCQHLFWNLTGESIESFLQIVRDVGPIVYAQTRRGERRRINYPYILHARNRILLVIIWLRMCPEVAVPSGMFVGWWLCQQLAEKMVEDRIVYVFWANSVHDQN